MLCLSEHYFCFNIVLCHVKNVKVCSENPLKIHGILTPSLMIENRSAK